MMDWDARYSEPGYAYGTKPNDFLASVASKIPKGPVLCLAEGQGRNAVFLAQRGHRVVAVDSSGVGLAGAAALAESRSVSVETVQADLANFVIEPDSWSGIVAIFAHLPVPLRQRVHQSVVSGLRPGGLFVLEAYTPAQIALATGGPRDPELMMSLGALENELAGLELLIGRELEREVLEGNLHWGRSAVVQVLARKTP
jgi:SAM-dependent methyltransferase